MRLELDCCIYIHTHICCGYISTILFIFFVSFIFSAMDKSWINEDRNSLKYQVGLENFLIFAKENASNAKKVCCP